MKHNDCLDCGHTMSAHEGGHVRDSGRCNAYVPMLAIGLPCSCGGYTRNPLIARSQQQLRASRR